jgi:hypothetical protein
MSLPEVGIENQYVRARVPESADHTARPELQVNPAITFFLRGIAPQQSRILSFTTC